MIGKKPPNTTTKATVLAGSTALISFLGTSILNMQDDIEQLHKDKATIQAKIIRIENVEKDVDKLRVRMREMEMTTSHLRATANKERD